RLDAEYGNGAVGRFAPRRSCASAQQRYRAEPQGPPPRPLSAALDETDLIGLALKEARHIVWLQPLKALDFVRIGSGGCAALIHPTKNGSVPLWVAVDALRLSTLRKPFCIALV